MARDENTVLMENVRLIFRNFEGRPGKFNPEGQRNFGVVLPEDKAEAMAADGWPVKYLDPREEELEEDPNAPRVPWMKVTLKYVNRLGEPVKPPNIRMVTSNKPQGERMEEDEVKELDHADIVKVDLIVRPFSWDINGKTGISAYLKSLFVTIEEDELEAKYSGRGLS